MDRTRILEDAILVLRSQQGDGSAFAELVERWQSRLQGHISRLIPERDSTWDVLQETWVAVINGLARLNDPESFPKWVYRIATNKANDWIRRRCRERQVHTSYGNELRRETHQEQTTGDLQAAVLESVLASLPGEQRVLLNLYYAEGFGVADIAGILGIPAGTVKSRLHHLRRSMRQLLQEEGENHGKT